jgi:hypothetical protein
VQQRGHYHHVFHGLPIAIAILLVLSCVVAGNTLSAYDHVRREPGRDQWGGQLATAYSPTGRVERSLGREVVTPDAPDYSKYQLWGAKEVLSDLGELAARQDARDVWDRRGQVIWFDRFEGGLAPWNSTFGGTGGGYRIDTVNSEWGGYCLRLIAGSDGSTVAASTHYFSPAELNSWGFESGVAFPVTFGAMRYRMLMYDGTTEYQAAVDLDYPSLTLKVLDNTLGSVVVASVGNPVHLVSVYHQLKLVADFKTLKYVRLMYDNNEYDLSAFTIAQAANADTPNRYVGWRFTGVAASNKYALVGHAIISVGEP